MLHVANTRRVLAAPPPTPPSAQERVPPLLSHAVLFGSHGADMGTR